MCGITGIVDIQGRRPVDERLVRAMNERLRRRGPDGEGFHFSPGVGFGHRRLSIIDLEGGKQPLYNEDGSVVVTYNGEIYNYAGLIAELTALGHTFRTRCDTEVIVHAWEQWGEECLSRFNGMFAFAVWDEKRDTLFIARDRLGVKPLHYAVVDGRLIFASELKSIMACAQVPHKLDAEAIEDYFTFGYVPDPKTIYSSVRKLEPGTFLRIKRGPAAQPKPVRYWDVPLAGERSLPGTEADWNAQLRDRLKDAVRMRLVAEVPLGAFLSGGIDSSAVVAMMRELGTEHLLTCSIGFKEPEYDESRYAQLVAGHLHTDHKSETVAAADFGLLDGLVDIYDEPFADSSAIPTYRVCELARRHVTVALSGDAGDENFIGYRRYRLFAGEESIRSRLPLGLRRAIFGPLGALYPKLDWAPRPLRGKTTFQALARDSLDAYLHGVSIFPEEGRRELFSQQFSRDLQGYQSKHFYRAAVTDKQFSDPLAMVQYLDFKTYLPGDILTKVDRASMANSLEVRVPFLDYRFVEWAAQLPTAVKLRGAEGKAILKKAMEPLLPREVLYRKKMGFAVPIDMWFRGPLTRRVESMLNGEVLRDSGVFDPARLGSLLREHESGRRNHSAVLWALLMFEGFLRKEQGTIAPEAGRALLAASG
jgi:asparagine synthase (glutamine-hydrolysing)